MHPPEAKNQELKDRKKWALVSSNKFLCEKHFSLSGKGPFILDFMVK